MWKAFAELEALGLIGPERPRMVSVQAEGCAPIVRAFETGAETAERWEGAATRAGGLRVPAAVGDKLILAALRESGGTAVAVSEEALTEAQGLAGRLMGTYVAPESGAALAAVRRAARSAATCGGRRGGGRVRLRDRAEVPAASRPGSATSTAAGWGRRVGCASAAGLLERWIVSLRRINPPLASESTAAVEPGDTGGHPAQFPPVR